MLGKQKPVELVAEFNQCPNCGSERRFAKSIADELIEKGLMGKDLNWGLHLIGGPIYDQRKIPTMLVGVSTAPVALASVDVCLDCGTIYAIRLEKGEAVLGTTMGPIQQMPNTPQSAS